MKIYPTPIIPKVQIKINIKSSLGLMAFLSIIIDGRLKVVTAIINDNTTPSLAPLASKASAIGIQPKISAYIGIPASVAINTPNGLPLPRKLIIRFSGI